MSQVQIICDQAIFTSVRAPMGEGYRIIAASGGLRPEERQTITRNSPSHGSLCAASGEDSVAASMGTLKADGSDQPAAVSFYPLATERLCVAISCPAGAEHTGRGGDRVYTHIAVMEASDFVACGYNPFRIVDAMVRADLTTPQLKPPVKLPDLVLEVDLRDEPVIGPWVTGIVDSARRRVLAGLLERRAFIVHLEEAWCQGAHGLLLGIPGPLRAKIAFCSGLRFSMGRSHHLQLLNDDKRQAKTRSSGQRVEYVDGGKNDGLEPPDQRQETGGGPPNDSGAWLEFVEQHWIRNDLGGLERRTSRAFADVTPAGRQRLGEVYRTIDELESADAERVIAVASEYVDRTADAAEGEVLEELISVAQSVCLVRFRDLSWPGASEAWRGLTELWRRSVKGWQFAHVAIEQFVRRLCKSDWLGAAEAALEASTPSRFMDATQHQELMTVALEALTEGLERWTAAIGRGEPATRERVARAERACERWRSLAGTNGLLPRCDVAIERIWAACPEGEAGPAKRPAASVPTSDKKPEPVKVNPPARQEVQPTLPKGPILPRRMSVSGTRPIRR